MKIIAIIVSTICIIYSTCQTQNKEGDRVALSFMNDYVQHRYNVMRKIDNQSDSIWILNNKYLTIHFKQSYVKLLKHYSDEGDYMDDDPILDTNGGPDSAFVVLKTKNKNGYVKLIEYSSQFIEIVKVKKLNNRWFVDGAGRINIPPKYQLK